MSPNRAPHLKRSLRRWKSLCALLAIATFTLLGAFYLPLRRVERQLRSELAASRQSLLEQTTALETSQAKSASLARELDTQNVALVDVKERIDKLQRRLSRRFSQLDKAGLLSITSAGDRVSIAISSQVLFPGNRATVPKEGRILLCQLSRILVSEFSDQIRVTGYFGKTRIEDRKLRALYDSTWELSAVRAATAAKVLERGCGAPTDRFLVVGYGPRPAGPIGENVAFELVVKPGE